MPDILIGNVRGPQGETGPANTLLASVYQFCASDTGATIPQDGAWTSGVPQIEKGKYIWCRNILTWDSGPETILYSVGYVGYDGEFNGIELVNELGQRVDALEDRVTPISKGGTESTTLEGAKAKLGITALVEALEKVNDYTTGINLLRGTSDFRPGVDRYGTIVFSDGFYIQGNATPVKDDDGFYSVKVSADSQSVWSSRIPGLSKGDTVTVSFDIRFDNVSGLNEGYTIGTFHVRGFDWNTSKFAQAISLKDCEVPVSQIKIGKWYRINKVIEINVDTQSNDISTVQLKPNATLFSLGTSYRLLKTEFGEINHSIWSASPLDVDYINDATTGINLFRGTKDWVNLSTGVPNNIDGFIYNATNYEVKETIDGTRIVTFNKSLSSPSYINSSPIKEFKTDDFYTLSYEVMFHRQPTVTALFSLSHRSATTTKRNYVYAISQLGPIELEKWYKVVFPVKVIDKVEDGDYLFATLGLQNENISFTPLCLYKGNINNPIWSASPSDVASISLQTAWDNASEELFTQVFVSGQNLDDYTYPCSFICKDPSIKNGLVNAPSGSGGYGIFYAKPFFHLQGSKGNVGQKATLQTWIDARGYHIYMRSCLNDGRFDEWKQII